MNTPATIVIPARNVRRGATLVDTATNVRMRVLHVCGCSDGTIRIVTDHSEQRMTGSIPVRVAN